MTTIAIAQSCYLPWKGYFDLIRRADVFVLYDCVQYTPRDWRNRNRIKTPHGLHWLTIPVYATRNHRICDVACVDGDWHSRHWSTIRHAYARAPHFAQYAPILEELYQSTDPMLSAVNQRFLECICKVADIFTPIYLLREHIATQGDRTDKLIAVCQHYNATRYLSGPRAKAYLDVKKFLDNGIEVEWMCYDHYPEYPQLHPPFVHATSIIDLLFNVGDEWKIYI